MRLLYVDESGSTGLDLDNKNQPYFILARVCVEDKKWHKINDYFEKEKIKICPDFKNTEIHTNELFNTNKKSPFYKNNWKDNFIILEKLVDLVSSLNIPVSNVKLLKKAYKRHFGNNIVVDPYLYCFSMLYEKFNETLKLENDFGIVFCDELKKMEKSLEVLYPKLQLNNKNIIERTFYLDSKKNNFIQIADICSFYINKYNCIKNNYSTMDNFKKNHCINMYEKLFNSVIGKNHSFVVLEDYDSYFE